MLLIKSLKSPSDNFKHQWVYQFCKQQHQVWNTSKARSSSTVQQHFYFNRIARLYNHLPVIDLSLSISTIKHHLTNYFWSHFINNFNSERATERACTFHLLCPCYRCTGASVSINFNQL